MSHRNVRSSVYVADIACYRSREGIGGLHRPEEVAGWTPSVTGVTQNKVVRGAATDHAKSQGARPSCTPGSHATLVGEMIVQLAVMQ